MTVLQKIGHYLAIALKYLSLVFFSFVAVLPVVSCVITAFKTEEEYQNTNVMTLPVSWLNFDNFLQSFDRANMGRAFVNSLIILVCVLTVSVLVGTSLAYVLNRFKFPGNGLIRNLFLFATLLPGVAMQVAVYGIMDALNFINSLPGYIIMMCGTDVIAIYIYIQFFENISVSLDESAIIDGAELTGLMRVLSETSFASRTALMSTLLSGLKKYRPESITAVSREAAASQGSTMARRRPLRFIGVICWRSERCVSIRSQSPDGSSSSKSVILLRMSSNQLSLFMKTVC